MVWFVSDKTLHDTLGDKSLFLACTNYDLLVGNRGVTQEENRKIVREDLIRQIGQIFPHIKANPAILCHFLDAQVASAARFAGNPLPNDFRDFEQALFNEVIAARAKHLVQTPAAKLSHYITSLVSYFKGAFGLSLKQYEDQKAAILESEKRIADALKLLETFKKDTPIVCRKHVSPAEKKIKDSFDHMLAELKNSFTLYCDNDPLPKLAWSNQSLSIEHGANWLQ